MKNKLSILFLLLLVPFLAVKAQQTGTGTGNFSMPCTVANNVATCTGPVTLTIQLTPTVTMPSITTQPTAKTVTAPATATFSVVGVGTPPLSYQWKKNGANINGANAASYTTPATSTADNGAAFAVIVTNSAGSVTSASAILTVNAAATKSPTTTTLAVQVCDASFNCPRGQTSAPVGAGIIFGVHTAYTTTAAPTGTFCIKVDGATTFFPCNTAAVADDTASNSLMDEFRTSSLPAGVHTIQATYSGDATHTASSSAVLTFTVGTVTPPPVAALTLSPANQTCDGTGVNGPKSVQFKAVDQNGVDQTASSTWTSSDSTNAPITTGGLVNCGAPANPVTATITATEKVAAKKKSLLRRIFS